MIFVFDATNGTPMRGYNILEDFSAFVEQAPLTTNPVAGTTTTDDTVWNTVTTSGSDNNWHLHVSESSFAPGKSLVSQTPSVCSVDSAGNVTRITDGVCHVDVVTPVGTRRYSQTMLRSGAGTIKTDVSSYLTGSLRKYLRDQQVAALAGVTAGASAQRATIDGTVSGAVNTGNFLRAQGKTGFAGFALDILDQMLAVDGPSARWKAWISPRHYISWEGHGVGSTATRTPTSHDYCISYSTTAWTGTLTKLLPANWRNYLPRGAQGPWENTNIACWSRPRNVYSGSDLLWAMPQDLMRSAVYAATDPLSVYQRSSDGYMYKGGDSGTPMFCGINGHLIALSHVFYGSSGGYYHYADDIALINSTMNDLSTANGDANAGTYAVQTVDLSGFNVY